MNCSTVYIGMDVRKENFSLICCTNEKCGILTPTIMPVAGGKKNVKTDKRDDHKLEL